MSEQIQRKQQINAQRVVIHKVISTICIYVCIVRGINKNEYIFSLDTLKNEILQVWILIVAIKSS